MCVTDFGAIVTDALGAFFGIKIDNALSKIPQNFAVNTIRGFLAGPTGDTTAKAVSGVATNQWSDFVEYVNDFANTLYNGHIQMWELDQTTVMGR